MPIALKDRCYKAVLEKLSEILRENPDADVSGYIQKLDAELEYYEHWIARQMLTTFFLNLYQQDVVALKRDFCKAVVLGGKEADANERAALLRCLHGALEFYYGDDYSTVMNMCDDVKAAYDMEEAEITDEDSPFV